MQTFMKADMNIMNLGEHNNLVLSILKLQRKQFCRYNSELSAAMLALIKYYSTVYQVLCETR